MRANHLFPTLLLSLILGAGCSASTDDRSTTDGGTVTTDAGTDTDAGTENTHLHWDEEFGFRIDRFDLPASWMSVNETDTYTLYERNSTATVDRVPGDSEAPHSLRVAQQVVEFKDGRTTESWKVTDETAGITRHFFVEEERGIYGVGFLVDQATGRYHESYIDANPGGSWWVSDRIVEGTTETTVVSEDETPWNTVEEAVAKTATYAPLKDATPEQVALMYFVLREIRPEQRSQQVTCCERVGRPGCCTVEAGCTCGGWALSSVPPSEVELPPGIHAAARAAVAAKFPQ